MAKRAFERRKWGERAKITIEREGKRESWIVKTEEVPALKRAVKRYLSGEIRRGEVRETLKARIAGRGSEKYSRLIKKVAKRRKLATEMPFRKEAIPLGEFKKETLRDARAVFQHLAKQLPEKDVTELLIMSKEKADLGFYYNAVPLDENGNGHGKIQFKKTAPAVAAAFLEHLLQLSDRGALPEYLERPEDLTTFWGNIPKNKRITADFRNNKPSELNGHLAGFKIWVTWIRPW